MGEEFTRSSIARLDLIKNEDAVVFFCQVTQSSKKIFVGYLYASNSGNPLNNDSANVPILELFLDLLDVHLREINIVIRVDGSCDVWIVGDFDCG